MTSPWRILPILCLAPLQSLAFRRLESANVNFNSGSKASLEISEKRGSAVAADEDRGNGTGALEPPAGGSVCAQYPDVDEYKKSTGGVCYVRLYKCSDIRNLPDLDNQNIGDVAWALTRACNDYGKFLHVYHVKYVAAFSKAGEQYYSKCNDGPFGRWCGCGLDGTRCGRDPDKTKRSANTIGKRVGTPEYYMKQLRKQAKQCPCWQYSLPTRAKGTPSAAKAQKLIAQGNKLPISLDAPFQWKLESYDRAIDIKTCLDKHVRKPGFSTKQQVDAMKKTLKSKPAGCGDVRAKTTPGLGPPKRIEVADNKGKWAPIPESASDELLAFMSKQREKHETKKHTYHLTPNLVAVTRSSGECRPMRVTSLKGKSRSTTKVGSCDKLKGARGSAASSKSATAPGKGSGKGKTKSSKAKAPPKKNGAKPASPKGKR